MVSVGKRVLGSTASMGLNGWRPMGNNSGWDQYRNRRHQNEGSRIDYVMVVGRSRGWGATAKGPLEVSET